MMKSRGKERLVGAGLLLIGIGLSGPLLSVQAQGSAAPSRYRSPTALALSPTGSTLYVCDRTAGNVSILHTADKSKRGQVDLQGQPEDMALSADGRLLYVAERETGTVAVIDTEAAAVRTRISVGGWPRALAIAHGQQRLYVCRQDAHDVSIIDLSQPSAAVVGRVPVLREPSDIALTPDERFAVVANQLPDGPATNPSLGAKVSVLDCRDPAGSFQVSLPAGATCVNGICTSPDGRWAYVVHQLGRFNLPVTQLERGWVNTSALSIVDLRQRERLATLLLDSLTRGAPDPYAIVCSRDGNQLWIAHAGVHEISVIQVGLVHQLLNGQTPPFLAELKIGNQENIWVRLRKDRGLAAELENDLSALYLAKAIRRFDSAGLGPRDLLLSPDENELYVANYFSGSVAVIAVANGNQLAEISLGPQGEPDAIRRGELVFHNARHAFQQWQSCASCHPNDARTDGLRWDFLRDGIGNPKDTISLVLVGKTPPHNRRATRKDVRECAQTGLSSGHMIVPEKQTVDDLMAYLQSLRPEANPHLVSGKLSEAAVRGQQLFEGRAGCARCHPAPLFTDRKMHNLGAASPTEPDGRYDTPSLVELHRTAPYLHDGRAATVKDALTTHNPQDLHGKIKGLSAAELDDLIAYVLAL